EVVVLAHEAEVAVAQLDRPPQRPQRLVGPVHQRVGAGQVVVRQRVVGPKTHQPLVDAQALGESALERQQVAQDAERVYVVRRPPDHAAEERQLELQLALLGGTRPGLARRRQSETLAVGLAWLWHRISPAWTERRVTLAWSGRPGLTTRAGL